MSEGGESPRETSGESGGIVRKGEKGTRGEINREFSDKERQSLKDLRRALRKALDAGDFDKARILDNQILDRTIDQKKKELSDSEGERKAEKGESSARDMGESEASRAQRSESKSSREKSDESGSGGRVKGVFNTSNSSGESGSADRGRYGGGRSTGRGLIINSNGESS
ncbi:MAG: hypothetical protein Q7S53_05085 [bacterium]|nr:hypothetical protein [bacterium]